jgi:carboxymethylenebutenolidase
MEQNMCYDAEAAPPVQDRPVTDVRTTAEVLTSADGTRFAAFLAEPATPVESKGVGVVVLPDNLGLRGFYDELATRLAEQGHPALAIDYYGRTDGVTRDRGEDFPVMKYLGELTKDGLYADFDAAIAHLRTRTRAVVTLGFCLGGRFAFLTAAERFGLAGAIGFYGATQDLRGTPGPTALAHELTAPILGLFGEADEGIPAPVREAFDTALTEAGVEHEIVTYPGAPHGFFDAALRIEHPEACADSWRRVLGFLERQSTE